MIDVAVCDDEKNIRTYICSLIQKQGTECRITEYASAEEYLSAGVAHSLLFLDIEMKSDGKEDKNGMWLARQLRSMELARQPVIIFVTGYETYVYDAFDVGAFQYLLKPIDEERFSQVFARAVRQIAAEREKQKEAPDRQALLVPQGSGKRAIPYDDIYYLESQGHKIVLVLKEEKAAYYAKIGELEKQLAGQFFRIHKGYLINLSHVEAYNRSEVTMANGDRLQISKYKYDEFRKAYLEYISEG